MQQNLRQEGWLGVDLSTPSSVVKEGAYFFLAGAFFLAAFLAGAFFLAAFLAGAFLAGAFFLAAFLAGAFFLAAFLAGAFFFAVANSLTSFRRCRNEYWIRLRSSTCPGSFIRSQSMAYQSTPRVQTYSEPLF